MNIGNKIKILCKQQGITQEQLAESIGVSFQAVSKWENNIALNILSYTKLKTLFKVFNACSVKITCQQKFKPF